jgi:hypothetical protein
MSDVMETAAKFARALHEGDNNAAHELLLQDLASSITSDELQAEFNALSEDMGGITGIGQPMVILEDWPGMSANDKAMVYVPLEGDIFSEAITVAVAEKDGAFCISSIGWGRP